MYGLIPKPYVGLERLRFEAKASSLYPKPCSCWEAARLRLCADRKFEVVTP